MLTAGLASMPYDAYYHAGYQEVERASGVDRALDRAPRVWLVYTFPVYIESRQPDLWKTIETRGREVFRARGSIGDGDVVVVLIERE